MSLLGLFLMTSTTLGIFAKTPPEEREKPFGVELSIGAAATDPSQLFLRTRGIDKLLEQFVSHYGGSSSASGAFKETKLMLPFNLSLRYTLSERWFLKGGLELAIGSNQSQKEYTLTALGNSETQRFELNRNLSYIMILIGGGYRLGNAFELYGLAGLGLPRMTHTEQFSSESNQMNSASTREYAVSGSAPALLLGGQYRIPLAKKDDRTSLHAFIKLEILLMNCSTLDGTKTISYQGTGDSEETVTGTLYRYQWNPYAAGGFEYWDLHSAAPSANGFSNVEPLSLNLTSIRLMTGIAF